MASVAVTKDVVKTIVNTAGSNLAVTVTVSALTWSVYCRIIRGGVAVFDPKVIHGGNRTFSILTGDRVDAWATGTGNIVVTTA